MAKNLRQVGLDFFETAQYKDVVQIPISQPPAAVFAAVADDPAGWGNWFPGFSKTGRYVTPAPNSVGSQREMTMRGMSLLETVIAWDEPSHWAFYISRATMPGVRAMAEDYRLEPQEGGTLLTWTVALDMAPAAKPMAALMGKLGASTMRKAVAKLEIQLSANSAPS
ncbi:SRPBCC family protein [Jatrophihabitans sp. DSM 45814]